ncbi:universal stress protein [Tateyamaria omphalii]|uniref:universal stress protein n=1 Tax=Tateyamaria omphalii TaxID=299262 RepID=UPI0016784BC1|nr:universal stress protein [Tateyamaria omphalii]GGX70716.1 universal stress protein [Tateyamaria omphalii]
MYSKILVPMALDHDVSPQTLDIAKALAAPGGDIVAFHVHEALQGSVAAYVDQAVVDEGFARARQTLTDKTAHLDGVQTEIVRGHTYRSIIDYAAQNIVDCIVIGSHRPGLSDYLLGSTAARVVRHAPCAVHVYRST